MMNMIQQGSFTSRFDVYIRNMLYIIAIAVPLHPILGDVAIFITTCMALYNHFRFHKIYDIHFDSLFLSVLLFVCWTFLSSLLSSNRLFSVASCLYQIGECAIVYFLMRFYLKTPTQWKYYIYAMLVSSLIVALIGIYQYIFITEIQMHTWVDADKFPNLMRRMYSTLMNPNLYGAYLLIILSAIGSFVLKFIQLKKWKKLIYIGILGVVLLISMILTYSRGIWISFACIILFWGIIVNRKLLWTLLLIPIVLYFYHGEVGSRLWSLFSGSDTSVALRWALWDSTTYMIADHPLWGVGWNTFQLEYPSYNYFIQDSEVLMYHAHNMILNISAEAGILGMVFFMLILGTHLWSMYRKKEKYHTSSYRSECISSDSYSIIYDSVKWMLGAIIVGVLISGLSDYELYSHQISIVFWQTLGLCACVIEYKNKNDNKSPYKC